MPPIGPGWFSRTPHRLVIGLVAMSFAALLVAPCRAQDYDEKQFIEGLAKRGLDSAIEYLIANPPANFDDQVTLFTALVDDYLPAQNDPRKFQQVFDRLAGMYDKLIAAHPDRQPILASDYAQSLLFSVLTGQTRADLFVAWGVPTDAQAQLARQLIRQSSTILAHATETVANLTHLTRQPDFIDKYVNTGLWDKLKEYGTLRIPYFYAWTQMYQAALPDAPQHDRPPKTSNPGLASITAVITQYDEQTIGFKARCHLLRGRLFLIDHRPDKAIRDFDAVRAFDAKQTEPEVRWLAQLGKIMALRQNGDTTDADKQFNQLLKDPVTCNPKNLLYRILLYDNRVRDLRCQMARATDAGRRHELLIASYKPYETLLADPALPDTVRPQVEAFIFDRLTTGIDPDTDVSALPPMVQLAMATRLYDQALASGISHADKALLQKALKVLTALTTNAQVSAATKARAMQMAGACQYLTGQGGYAIQTMTGLADQFPDRPEGQAGINAAVTWSEGLYKAFKNEPAKRKTAGDLYEKALRILLDKYPSIDLARDGFYMLGAYLREQERYPDAIQAYDKVPTDHRLYIDALYEKLVCMNAVWAEKRDQQLNRHIRETVRTLQQAIHRNAASLNPKRLAQLNRYNALASLIRLNLLIESSSDYTTIEQELNALSGRYPGVADLPMRVKVMNIRIMQKRGQWAQAETELKTLARQQPDKAGPLAIGVIQNIFADINQAQLKKEAPRVRQLGQVALGLADWVWGWVQGQPDWSKMPAEEKITYELMPAKANLYAGNFSKAVELFTAIRTRPAGKNNIEAVSGLAEAYFHIGEQLTKQAAEKPDQAHTLKQQALRAYTPASKLCEMILDSEKDKKNRYYWQAQCELLTMVDRTTRRRPNVSILKTIQRLKHDNPNLGGEPWASTLRALEAKHTIQ